MYGPNHCNAPFISTHPCRLRRTCQVLKMCFCSVLLQTIRKTKLCYPSGNTEIILLKCKSTKQNEQSFQLHIVSLDLHISRIYPIIKGVGSSYSSRLYQFYLFQFNYFIKVYFKDFRIRNFDLLKYKMFIVLHKKNYIPCLYLNIMMKFI